MLHHYAGANSAVLQERPCRRAFLPVLSSRRMQTHHILASAPGLRPSKREDGQAPRQRQRRPGPDSSQGGSGGGGAGFRRDGARREGGRRPAGPPLTNRTQKPDIPIVRQSGQGSAYFFTTERFAGVGASEEVVEALAAVGITRPSHIQAAAYRAMLSPAQHVVLADHAGSGKTLAYLLPLVQQIKEEERAAGRPGTVPHCPRVVVVVPTAELCGQVVRVCRALSRSLAFRSLAATGGHKMRTQREALAAGVDVLVATPGRLRELMAAGSSNEEGGKGSPPALRLDGCRAIVLDEVDVLLGDASAFADQVRPLQAATPPGTRFVFVTATIPDYVFQDLEQDFPGVVAAFGPGLHRTAPGVTEQLVDCSGGDEVSEESGFRRKAAALFAVLQEQRAKRAIVFCNKIETCRKVENFLNRTMPRGEAEVLPYHAAVTVERRENNLKAFLAAPSGGSSNGSSQRQILVCTDRASRGVDSAFVDHVVLFDFPRDPSEYVRRVGRTARGAHGSGVVSILVLGRQVKLAQDIINRNQRGMPVHHIPTSIPVAGALGMGEAAEEEGAQWQQARQATGEDGDQEEEESVFED